MAFFTGWAAKIGDAMQGLLPGLTGVLLSKSDGSADIWQSDGSGAANVAITSSTLPSGAATAAGQVSLYAGSAFVRSAAAERYSTVKTSAGILNRCRVYNSGAPSLYLVLVDQVAAPTTGVTACIPLCEVAGGATVVYPFAEQCTLGMHVCLSTDKTTYTDPGAVGWFASWRD